MRYQGDIYRPPSEAGSTILQVTYGCSHNACTFCDMYTNKKFTVRPIEEVLEDITKYTQKLAVRRIFLADGNALCLSMHHLEIIFDALQQDFVNLERIAIYATAKDVVNKPLDALCNLRKRGLKIVYMGVESGSDTVLKKVNKNSLSQDVILATDKLKQADIALSAIIISGLGGQTLLKEHATASARLINKIQPQYLALMTLMNRPGTVLSHEIKRGKFKLLTSEQIVEESRLFIENLELNHTLFRSNHISNSVSLAGVLNRDKQKLMQYLQTLDTRKLKNLVPNQSY